MRRLALWCGLTLGLALAFVAPSAAMPPAWGFSLPTLDADRFLGPADFAGPVLVNFWGIDCPPCVAELPRLQRFARQHSDWTVLLVTTDAPIDARRFLSQQRIDLPVVRGGNGVATLMRRAGEQRAGLPFSVIVVGDRICRTHRGELQEADLQAARRACDALARPRAP